MFKIRVSVQNIIKLRAQAVGKTLYSIFSSPSSLKHHIQSTYNIQGKKDPLLLYSYYNNKNGLYLLHILLFNTYCYSLALIMYLQLSFTVLYFSNHLLM